jgi:hypothetical protein
MSKKFLLVLIGTTTLTACVQAPADPALLASAQRPVTCSGADDCSAKWSRAVNWVIQNSSWKIQTQTDQLIQTYGPGRDDPSSAFTITKVYDGKGTSSIQYSSACSNIFGCIPNGLKLQASFNDYVMGT